MTPEQEKEHMERARREADSSMTMLALAILIPLVALTIVGIVVFFVL